MKTQMKAGRRVVAQALREFSEGSEQGLLERFAYNLCRNAEEARELVQETYYRALKFGAYEPRGLLAAWLRMVLRNIFVDSRRRASWHDVSLDETAPETDALFVDLLVDGSLPAGDAMEREETRKAVRRALAALPEHHRQVVELCYMRGVPYEDAARRLGIMVGTLRSRLARARARLRRTLESY
jgi:RNA polymerase sigma-70 factor (ECF subfamily)